jgi:putative MATE family efflux protein
MNQMGSIAQPDPPPGWGAMLTTGSVAWGLAALAGPMLLGYLSYAVFGLMDAFFVARLGRDELAALSYTFPVVLFVGSLTVGLGIGTGSVVSRAIGQGDAQRVRRLTTDALLLSVLVVVVLAAVGLGTIRPLFGALGADGHILRLVEQYMTIWYVGMVFVVVPVVGNSAILATGDTISAGAIMLVANVLNLALDPLLIFGLGALRGQGIAGAAHATVLARAAALLASLTVLHFRKRMLSFAVPPAAELLRSWGGILYVGGPAAATVLMGPLSLGVITRMVSAYGPSAVGAVGAAGKVEAFALTVVIVLASVIVPFVGQNWGAGRFDRAAAAGRLGGAFAFGWGLLCLGVLLVAARPLARLFGGDPAVIDCMVLYLCIVPIGYGMAGVNTVACSGMNAINQPLHAAGLAATRLLLLTIPLAALGGLWLGLPGIFAGTAAGNVLGGAAAIIWVRRLNATLMPSPTHR